MTAFCSQSRESPEKSAPLLFTALNNQFWSTDFRLPIANLPVTIFQFAMSPFERMAGARVGGALLITLVVLVLNIIRARISAETIVSPKLEACDLNFYYGDFTR